MVNLPNSFIQFTSNMISRFKISDTKLFCCIALFYLLWVSLFKPNNVTCIQPDLFENKDESFKEALKVIGRHLNPLRAFRFSKEAIINAVVEFLKKCKPIESQPQLIDDSPDYTSQNLFILSFVTLAYGYFFSKKIFSRSIGDLVVYGSKSCPWCDKQIKYLNNKGIRYKYVDASSQYRPSFVKALPTILLNGQVIEGYTEL